MLILDDEDEETLNADFDLCRPHPDSILSFLATNFDASCLAEVDDDLLLAPKDTFADLCYSECMCEPEADLEQILNWRRRVSRMGSSTPGMKKDLCSDSESDSDSELVTPTDAADARWREGMSPKSPKRVVFAALPSSPVKSGVTLPLDTPAFCDPEATMAFLLSSLPSDPQHSVHYFPTWSEKRHPEKSSIKSSMMRGLAGLRAGLSR